MKLKQNDIDIEMTPQQLVIAVLSEQIAASLRTAAAQQYHPSADADFMDNTISGNLKRAEQLRQLRHQYENICTEVLVPPV